jgi:DNA-binding CsgD family transcriptional regulator
MVGAAPPRADLVELIGRAAELARLDAAIAALPRQGGALVISGDAGIGKSALLLHARERAAAVGARTLITVGVESEIELAFAGLHQILAPLMELAAGLPDPRRRALEAAFGMHDDLEPDRFHVALAAHQLLVEAAAARPLLLLVDDAHWLDRSSQDVLTFVARRLADEPLLLVAALRPDRGSPLERERLPDLPLGRLREGEAAALIDREAPRLHPIGRARVLAEAAGNPLALVELTDPAAAPPARFSPGTPNLTGRLEQAFAARLDELPGETRFVLLAAALDGAAPLEEVLAAASALRDAPLTLAAFDPAARAGLVELEPGALRFRHPLIRSAVRQGSPPAAVIAMYASLATVVADPERRLWHRANAAVDADEELAAALEAHAAAVRGRGAPNAAGAALERAAALSPDARRRAERLVRAAEVAYEVGMVEAAETMLAAAEELGLPPLEAARLAWLRQMISGEVWTEAGAAGVFVGIAREMVAGGDADAALGSLVPIAHRCWWTRTRTRTREYVVEAALEIGFSTADPRVLAVIAMAHPEATGPQVRAEIGRVRPREVDDPRAAMNLGIAAEKTGDIGAASTFLGRAVEGLREEGRLALLAQTLTHQAWTAIHAGDWPTAVRAAAEGAALARETQQPQYRVTGQMVGALAVAHQGGEVEPLLAGPERALLGGGGGGPLLAPAHLARGAAALGEGRGEDAVHHLWPVFDKASPAYHRFMRWSGLLDLVEGSRGGPEAGRIDDLLAELEEVERTSGAPFLGVVLQCARAAHADDEAAPALQAEALASEQVAAYPFLRARTQLTVGRRLRHERREADSRAPLREALDAFDRLGAARWSERAREELRATGERTRPRTPEARDQLTAQELRIAELAAQGLSNREIGARLFLSHRTVGSHLYRTFPKLGITTRAQLRDALETTADAGSVE